MAEATAEMDQALHRLVKVVTDGDGGGRPKRRCSARSQELVISLSPVAAMASFQETVQIVALHRG